MSHLPPLRFGVADVHAHDLAGEQRGFVAAGAGADLHEDVLVVVRVLRLEQDLELLFERLLLLFELGQLELGELAQLLLALDRLQHLFRVGEALADAPELAVLGHDFADLGDRLHGVAELLHVADDVRVADLPLKLVVTAFDFFEFVVHGWRLTKKALRSQLAALRKIEEVPGSCELMAESCARRPRPARARQRRTSTLP